jgi:hypothetical protein
VYMCVRELMWWLVTAPRTAAAKPPAGGKEARAHAQRAGVGVLQASVVRDEHYHRRHQPGLSPALPQTPPGQRMKLCGALLPGASQSHGGDLSRHTHCDGVAVVPLQDQLKENMGAFTKELSEEALADINDVYKRFKDPATSA